MSLGKAALDGCNIGIFPALDDMLENIVEGSFIIEIHDHGVKISLERVSKGVWEIRTVDNTQKGKPMKYMERELFTDEWFAMKGGE